MKLKVNIPLVKEVSDGWEKYQIDGTLEAEFDGSEVDERELNSLLQKLDAQFLLIEDTAKLDESIRTLRKNRRMTDFDPIPF